MNEGKSQYNRREFIRMAALGTAGFYFAGCDTTNEKARDENVQKDSATIPQKTNEFSGQPTSVNVTYYKTGDEQFDILRKGHNKRIEKYPAVIALCHNTKGVQEALGYARKNRLAVAIKSGGHSLEGFSCNNGGLVINLSEFNKVKWEEDEAIRVGPACTLAQLNTELLPRNRQVPAGSCGGVGIGGLTLGGGYGMFSRKLGLTCDSLLEVTMVDGNGVIRNSAQEPELLWACRGGGGGNFGVVTELKFKTYPAAPHLISHRFRKFKCSTEEVMTRMEKWFELTENLPLHCFSGFVLNGKTVFILLTIAGEETEEVKTVYDAFAAFSDKVSKGEPSDLSSSLKNFYGIQYPVSYKNSSVGFYKNFGDIKDFIGGVIKSVAVNPGMIYAINTFGGKINDADAARNSAFAHRSYNFLSELQSYWSKPERESKLIAAFKETRDIFVNNRIKTEYFNYPDIDFKDWEFAYYGENYKRLQEVKRKYDPENLIRHEQSVRI